MEVDLGTMPKHMMDAPVKSEEPGKPKKTYPTLCIRDEAADAFKEQFGDCDVEDEYTFTVKARVSGTRSDEYGRSIDFQVLSILGDYAEEEDSEDEPKPKRGTKPPAKALAEYEGKGK